MEYHHKNLNDCHLLVNGHSDFFVVIFRQKCRLHEKGLLNQKRASEEAQGDAGVIDAVVFDVCGDEIGFGFKFGTGVAHGDFGPVVSEHGHVVEGVAEYDGVAVVGAESVQDLFDADGLVGRLDEEVFVVVAAPGEFPESLQFLLFAGEAGNVGFVYFVISGTTRVFM